ncbi:MAG: hypothetical protein KAQ85_02885, partial [Thermodesulfovibrionia bacterium]|nr:hypothetical protein [Thermodesulfovibrionia bacterium]
PRKTFGLLRGEPPSALKGNHYTIPLDINFQRDELSLTGYMLRKTQWFKDDSFLESFSDFVLRIAYFN